MKIIVAVFLLILLIGFIFFLNFNESPVIKSEKPVQEQIIHWSENLLRQVKLNENTQPLEMKLREMDFSDLVSGLGNDKAKLTFWINCYNAYYQILSRNKHNIKNIYTDKLIVIAHTRFSLDDIEHGILRKYRSKYSLGYLPQFFPSDYIKNLAVQQVDYRIHFALNCGAKSCPPIAFYSYAKIDEQLDNSAISFLEQETDILLQEKKIYTTTLFQWFRADFGGANGIRKVLEKYLEQDFTGFKIYYKDYDWSEDLHNFSDESIVE